MHTLIPNIVGAADDETLFNLVFRLRFQAILPTGAKGLVDYLISTKFADPELRRALGIVDGLAASATKSFDVIIAKLSTFREDASLAVGSKIIQTNGEPVQDQKRETCTPLKCYAQLKMRGSLYENPTHEKKIAA